MYPSPSLNHYHHSAMLGSPIPSPPTFHSVCLCWSMSKQISVMMSFQPYSPHYIVLTDKTFKIINNIIIIPRKVITIH